MQVKKSQLYIHTVHSHLNVDMEKSHYSVKKSRLQNRLQDFFFKKGLFMHKQIGKINNGFL